MNLFKSLFAASCVLVCCLGNDYPAKSANSCTGEVNLMLAKATNQMHMTEFGWNSFRMIDVAVLEEMGCSSDIVTDYARRAAEYRMQYR